MKFTVSTKPLKSVTDLGIIKANISKFYYRSNIVQITANRDTLKLNIEASGIKSKMTLKGSGDEDKTVSIMVECAMFKNLIDSIETDIVTFEFIEGGLYVHAGTSKFAIPQIIDVADVQLDEPVDQFQSDNVITITPTSWQFIKDHQMYAISTSNKHPVYMNVWVSQNKDVIVGDYDSSLFTYSKCGDFDTTCLFPTSLINLFTSIPEGSKAAKVGNSYVLTIETDSYAMVTEFVPKYESDESVGSYNSEIILNMLTHPESFITVDVAPISKFINQTSILRQGDMNKTMDFVLANGKLTLTNKASSYSVDVGAEGTYTVKFSIDLFKNVLGNFDSDKVNIAPMMRGENAIGCIFWTDTLTTLLAGQG
jgi:hypothetical protein